MILLASMLNRFRSVLECDKNDWFLAVTGENVTSHGNKLIAKDILEMTDSGPLSEPAF